MPSDSDEARASLALVLERLGRLRRSSQAAAATPPSASPSERLVTSVARSWEELHHLLFAGSWDERIGAPPATTLCGRVSLRRPPPPDPPSAAARRRRQASTG